LSESIDVLLNARKMAPDQAQTKFALVRAYLKAGKADDARQFLEGVLKEEPGSAEALVLRGAVNLSTDQKDSARTDFNLAIEKAPKNSIGYRALADLELKEGNVEKALAAVNAGLAALPGNTDLSFSLAAIHERKSDYEAAIAVYESLLQADPGSLLAANNYASLISDHRTDKESIEKAAAAAAILRGSPVPQFKDTLGWILFLRGDIREARTLLEAAVQALPELSTTNYHLGRLYLAEGDLTRAKEKLDAALKHASTDTERQRADAALKELASTPPKTTTQQQ
jgi:tetratricopeptide (TPR) repeat protein